MALHEEEVLGRAYDSRLMKRLLTYLRPYKWQTGIALGAIILKAGADVLGPYLTKIAVDRYLVKVPGLRSPFDFFLTLGRHRSDRRCLCRPAGAQLSA
jgi:ABC-type multidrug transport system fused ATPase/permease subunit